MLIDTHCHLLDPMIGNVSEVVKEAKKIGVEKIVCPMTELSVWDEAKDLAEREEGVFILAGIHPEELEMVGPLGVEMDQLREIVKHKKVKGIGEIGLDFYFDREKATKAKQIEFFITQMELAAELELPVVIHMRNAQVEMAEVLKKLKRLPQGQFHCFAGDSEFMKSVLSMGFYVSFCGNITYKSAEDLRNLAKKVPLDRLLLETDSPYLAPVPKRGSVNVPRNVKITAEFIAELRGEKFEDVARITSENAICLLSLDT